MKSAASSYTGPVLGLGELTVGYRRRPILTGVDAALAAGELACLVGPNGAGKSTLLRTIAGLQPALAGTCRIGGTPVSSMTRRQIAEQVAVVLTERVDPGRLTGREIVALGRHPHTGWTGRLDASDHRIIDRCLGRAGAEHLAGAEFAELSDGQRQRILVTRALAQQPRLLLLDEPTAFLDPPARIGLLTLLQAVVIEDNVAVLVCTHDVELAARTADTLWVADLKGTLVTGAPEDLIQRDQLAGPFSTGGAVFDPVTLTFVPPATSGPTAALRGEGITAVLAAHALRRAGYQVTGPEPNIAADIMVEVHPHNGDSQATHLTVSHRGVTTRHATMATFVRQTRKLQITERPA
jgi:iron complex transport system ATP-binding protein